MLRRPLVWMRPNPGSRFNSSRRSKVSKANLCGVRLASNVSCAVAAEMVGGGGSTSLAAFPFAVSMQRRSIQSLLARPAEQVAAGRSPDVTHDEGSGRCDCSRCKAAMQPREFWEQAIRFAAESVLNSCYRGFRIMTEYRLYCMGGDGQFTRVEEIHAEDDADALAKAQALKQPVKCELWNRDRKVAIVDPHRA